MKQFNMLIIASVLAISFATRVSGDLRENLAQAIATNNDTVNVSGVLPEDILDLVKTMVPERMLETIDKLVLKNAVLKDGIAGVSSVGFTLSGTLDFFGYGSTGFNLYSRGDTDIALEFVVGAGFKFSSLSPELQPLDAVKLSGVRLIVSSFDYTDPISKLPVKGAGLRYTNAGAPPTITGLGLNALAGIALDTGSLRNVKKLMETLGTRFMSGQTAALLNGAIFIPPTIVGSYIKLGLPLRIGVNFADLYAKKQFLWEPRVIKSIDLKDIILSVSPFKLADEFITIKSGIILGLVTQTEPLDISAEAVLGPNRLDIAGELSGMYEQAFGIPWLDLGDLTAGVECDFAAAAVTVATGLPFTGFNVGGSFSLGTGGNKSTMDMSAKVSLNATELPEFILWGRADQLPFTALLEFFAKAALSYKQQANISNALPDIRLFDVEAGIALSSYWFGRVEEVSVVEEVSMGVGKKDIGAQFSFEKKKILQEAKAGVKKVEPDLTQGLLVKGAMDIGGFTGAVRVIIQIPNMPNVSGVSVRQLVNAIVPTADFIARFKFIAQGYLDPINTTFFKFTSATDVKVGPSIDVFATLTDAPHLRGSAMLDIPFLSFNRAVEFSADKNGLYGMVSRGAFFNTEVKTITFRLPFGDFDKFLLSYEMNTDTFQQIKAAVKGQIKSWQNSITGSFEQKRKELAAEIKQKEMAIARKGSEKRKLEQECEQNVKSGKFWRGSFWTGVRDCFKTVGKDIEIQYDTLNKELHALKSELSKIAEKIPKKMLDVAGNVVDIATAVEITRIFGAITGADLKAAKAPHVMIELTVNAFGTKDIRTMDVQFDFKNPAASVKAIVGEIIDFFK